MWQPTLGSGKGRLIPLRGAPDPREKLGVTALGKRGVWCNHCCCDRLAGSSRETGEDPQN